MRFSTFIVAAAFAFSLPATMMAQNLTSPSQRELAKQKLADKDPQVIAHRIAKSNGGGVYR